MSLASRPIDFHALGARLHSAFAPYTPPSRGTSSARSPLLVILDLHGVLVQRLGSKDSRAAREAARNQRQPWARHNGYDIYLRPHLAHFLSICSSRHTLSIWSAGQANNVLNLFERVSSSSIMPLVPPLMQRLFCVWDRTLCRPDAATPNKNKYNHSVIKMLPDVWQHPTCSGEFGPRNTLIVDDTPSKIRFQRDNAVVMQEYCLENYPDTFNDDDSLLWLLLYIEYLVDAAALQGGPASYEDTGGIAGIRRNVYSFEQFWLAGFQAATKVATPEQSAQLASFAYVFFPPALVEEGERLSQAALDAAANERERADAREAGRNGKKKDRKKNGKSIMNWNRGEYEGASSTAQEWRGETEDVEEIEKKEARNVEATVKIHKLNDADGGEKDAVDGESGVDECENVARRSDREADCDSNGKSSIVEELLEQSVRTKLETHLKHSTSGGQDLKSDIEGGASSSGGGGVTQVEEAVCVEQAAVKELIGTKSK